MTYGDIHETIPLVGYLKNFKVVECYNPFGKLTDIQSDYPEVEKYLRKTNGLKPKKEGLRLWL